MIRKIVTASIFLLTLYISGPACDLERLAYQVSPWNDIEQPIFLKKSDLSNIPVIASDSSHSYDVLHYYLYLNLPMQDNYFEGSMTMTFEVVDDSIDEVSLDMVHMTAQSVILDGYPATFTQSDSSITVDLDDYHYAFDTLILTIYYHDSTTNRGYYYYPRNAYTFAEPRDARWWFPCFDEPWDKATSEIFVTVPEDYYVCSNGFLESVYHNPYDQTRTYHWENGDPIATYLISFIAMRYYALWEDYYVMPAGDTIPLLNMVFVEDSALAAYDFEHVPDMMQIFSQLFYPYPFNKYGQGAVSPFPYGAMEHQTMTTMNRNWISGTRESEVGLAHELAHMWWGDFVTLADWRHMWLNEGFATYGSGIFLEQFYSHEDFMEKMLHWRDIYIDHGNQYGHAPIYDPAYLFSVRVYFKGAWVLHMLRGLIGDNVFYNGLHSYASQFGYGNADTWDFIDVMETESGEELDWFFDQWVFGQAHPIYHYSWNYSGSGPYDVHLDIHQVQTAAPAFRMPITIRIYSGTNEYDFEVENQFEYQSYDFNVAAEPDSLALDPDNWILKEDSELTSEEGWQPVLPDRVELLKPYPNPFNGSVNISFAIEGSSRELTIDIYDIMGRKVKTLADENYEPGYYVITWDGRGDRDSDLSSGAYFVLMRSGEYSQTKKILYIR
ncbi:MAG: T9SS type A sorting domain-containing protein [Candidatus Zixiibacteriota bacterium]|nr:MAG: T9SS type A sorting domain-containing protein [candidate division Zixibacteria bacterium]